MTAAVTSRRGAVVLVLVGAGLLVLAAGRPWVTAVLAETPGRPAVEATGRAVAPASAALGLVALAGAVVLATSGRWVRRATALVLALTGVAGVALARLPATAPADAVRPAAAEASGLADPTGLSDVAVTAWPAVAVLGALAVAAGGVLALLRGGTWEPFGRKYERAEPAPADLGGREGAMDAWDALSRGDDPT